MTLRIATHADLDALVTMGQRFLHSTPYGDLIGDSSAQMRDTATTLIDGADGCVLVVEKHGAPIGMLGAVVFTHHISGERVAGEVFWWTEPEHRGCGLRLLRAVEAWALGRGAVRMQMIAPNREVATLYERLGYAPVETTYQRTLRKDT